MDTSNLLARSNFLLSLKELDSAGYKLACQILKEHNFLYYQNESPVISDKEYDDIFDLTKKFEQKHPDLIDPDSPIQKIAVDIETHDKFTKKRHIVPMMSLDNTYNQTELTDYIDRVTRL